MLISVVTPCYNEEGSIKQIYKEIKAVFQDLKGYNYEHIFIDNDSKDKSQEILKELAASDENVKVIINARNFGAIRSHYYGMISAKGDAVISIVADLQDPPAMIYDFLKKWEEGHRIVVGVIKGRKESFLMVKARNFYYNLIAKISDSEIIKNFTGFGLYDKEIIEILRNIDDPNPYFRGLISDIGFDIAKIEYVQPARHSGKTSTNWLYLYSYAMLGITSHSKLPLRLTTMFGFVSASVSLLLAAAYFIYKLVFWQSFSLGIAPVVIGLFFFSSVQLVFLGIVGEYLGAIHTQVLKRPLVIEKERINF